MTPLEALPPELWMQRPGFPRLAAALDAECGATRIVGGSVRDWLLDMPVSDVDLATVFAPEEVMRRLDAAGIRHVPTGLRHGTVSAILDGQAYEVTTLRRDVETDGRHATVAFTQDWVEDARRRDFTINALYVEPLNGTVHDYFNGRSDIAARVVRFIGDPLQRIAEDHLRILRFFRFSARYSSSLEPTGFTACTERAADLRHLSMERIRDELFKLLLVEQPLPVLDSMLAGGILEPVLPEIRRTERLAALISAEHRAGLRGEAIRRLASLIPQVRDTALEIAGRLRLSNADRNRLCVLSTVHAVPRNPEALAYAIGPQATLDCMLLTDDPRAGEWAPRLAKWRRPRLPIGGRDIIAMGVAPGPDIARLIAAVENIWIESGFNADRDRLLAEARRIAGFR